MECVTWVKCVNKSRIVQAVEVVQNCRRETCARVKHGSHPVREKMSSHLPVEIFSVPVSL